MLLPKISRQEDILRLAEEMKKWDLGEIRIMEVCGTHTMAIAKSGIKQILPENIHLISGPGCPVCVTPSGMMDEILRLSERDDVTITTYGDMIRVPGSVPGDNLQRRKALGAQVKIVYSAMDAVDFARENPGRKVVFLGCGFETTAPGTAAAVLEAAEQGIGNFYCLSMLKRVEPALRRLSSSEDFRVDGFLCPGHVATIIGEEGFHFLTDELGIPAVISGFEAGDIMTAVYLLVQQIAQAKPRLQNEYTRAVRPEGNPVAVRMMEKVFEPCPDIWRGLGAIPESGLKLREEYAAHDAIREFGIAPSDKEDVPGCRCGDVICGRIESKQCPLFGKACTPEHPVGPCMVSSEGSCAAAYKYM